MHGNLIHDGRISPRAKGLVVSGSRSLMAAVAVASALALAQPARSQHRAATNGESTETPASEPKKYAFEWGGVFELPDGMTDLVIQPGPDPSIDIALVPVADGSGAAFDAAVEQAVETFARGEARPILPGEEFTPGSEFRQLSVESDSEMRFKVRAPRSGRYALFTQHFADEFQTTFVSQGQKVFPSATRNFRDRFGQIVILPEAFEAFGIKIEPAAAHVLRPSFVAPARVAFNAERMAHVGSAVVGRVISLPLRQGDAVKTGDTLIVLDSPELGEAQSDYVQKRTLAQSAAPLVDLAKSAYERAKKLFEESQGTSLNEVQRRQAELQAAESALANARAGMTGAMNRLQLLGMTESEIKTLGETGAINPKYTIRAPIDGRIIRRDVTLGELVGPDRDALMVVADSSKLWVQVDVPEMRLREVTVGATARIKVAAFPGRGFEGVLSFISADLNEATRTAQVRVEVDNGDGLLRPGLFAQAEIIGAAGEAHGADVNGASRGEPKVLAVPESSIQMIEGRPVVFVPFSEKPNTYLKRPVTLGPPVGGMVPVLYGLREGEQVVTAATFVLKAELGKSSAKHEH
jgi:cobalt-zinc-cadmium efflux system membrane fusion protein